MPPETRAMRLSRMVSAEDVSLQLGGLLSAHSLTRMAKLGKISGACKIGGRYFFPPTTAARLVTDLSPEPEPEPARLRRPQPNTFDVSKAI